MTAPTGIGMWIAWNGPATTSLTPTMIAEQARARGLSWLAIKTGAASEGTRWLAHGAELIARCHDAGIKVYGWLYSMPGSWQDEVAHVARVLGQGADGYVLDAETEWEWAPGVEHFSPIDRRPTAAAYMAALRARVGEDAFIAHAPIWRPQSHERFPYVEFGERCSAVMPQFYWAAAGQSATTFCSRADDAWRTFAAAHASAAKPVLPIGITYGAGDGWDNFPGRLTAEDVTAFVDRYPVCSLFSWDAASKEAWRALRMLAPAPDAEPTSPGEIGPVAADPSIDVVEDVDEPKDAS